MLVRLARVVHWISCGLAGLALLFGVVMLVVRINQAVHQQGRPLVLVDGPYELDIVAEMPDGTLHRFPPRTSFERIEDFYAKWRAGDPAVRTANPWQGRRDQPVSKVRIIGERPHWTQSHLLTDGALSLGIGVLAALLLYGFGRAVRYVLANE